MTGPEHYRAAEALLSGVTSDRRLGPEGQERCLALAQAHATLALAAEGRDPHGGCTTIAEHQELQRQVEQLTDLVGRLAAMVTGRSAGHYHDATGHEDTLCTCPSPGASAAWQASTQTISTD